MRVLSVLCLVALVAGCSSAPGPVIAMFNGDSVNVQFAPISDPNKDTTITRAMANRVCEKRGLDARHAATRALSDQIWEYLYRCR